MSFISINWEDFYDKRAAFMPLFLFSVVLFSEFYSFFLNSFSL